MPFGDLLPALAAKKIDIVASTYSATPEREKVANFSQPYAAFRDELIVPTSNNKPYRSPADFKGMNLVTTKGAIYVNLLEQVGANVSVVNTAPQTITEVEAGHADGAINSSANGVYLMKGNAHPTLKIVDSYSPLFESHMSLVVQKGNVELTKRLDESLSKLKADGTINALAPICGYSAE